jgi:hypothetical protein
MLIFLYYVEVSATPCIQAFLWFLLSKGKIKLVRILLASVSNPHMRVVQIRLFPQ